MGQGKSRREQLHTLAVTLVVMCLCLVVWHAPVAWPQVLIYNHTSSVPVGWYLMMPVGDIEDGDIVGFSVESEAAQLAVERGWAKPDDVMLKEVGALPGEGFEIDDERGFYVRGKYLGQVQVFDGQDRAIPHLEPGQYLVEPGQFLPVTMNPMSYDGRYYGTVPLDNIQFRAVRLDPFE